VFTVVHGGYQVLGLSSPGDVPLPPAASHLSALTSRKDRVWGGDSVSRTGQSWSHYFRSVNIHWARQKLRLTILWGAYKRGTSNVPQCGGQNKALVLGTERKGTIATVLPRGLTRASVLTAKLGG